MALGVTLAALLLSFLFLTILRALRSNQHGIRRNLTAALGLAQLVFLLGINQADLPVSCLPSPRRCPQPAVLSGVLPSSLLLVPALVLLEPSPAPSPWFPLLQLPLTSLAP